MAGEQYAQEGQKVQLKDGTMAVVKGGQLVALPGGPRTAGGGGKKLSPQAQAFLNKMSETAQSAAEVGRLYDRAESSLETVKTGPNRGRFLEIATPEEGGGFLDTLGAAVVGGPARLIGAITPEETSAYQTVRGIQSGGVLEKQLAQKGPQTESDAARLMLTEISASKDPRANAEIIQAGREKIKRDQAKAAFYTRWTSKYGANGTNPEGETADEIWARSSDYIVKKIFEGKGAGKAAPKSGIKILSRRKVQ